MRGALVVLAAGSVTSVARSLVEVVTMVVVGMMLAAIAVAVVDLLGLVIVMFFFTRWS